MFLRRFALIFIVILLLVVLSGCAFLLSNIISGSRALTYTAYFYLNGLPKQIAEQIRGESAQSLNINLNYEVSLFFDSQEYKISTEGPEMTIIFNGLRNQAYSFAAAKSDYVDISAKLMLTYSTDTTNRFYETIEFPKSRYNLKDNEFYVLFNFTKDATDVKVLEKSKAYKFEIQTSSREYVRVFDGSNEYLLISENISGNYKCIFIAERGKTYTFTSDSGVVVTRTAQNDRDGEVINLVPSG